MPVETQPEQRRGEVGKYLNKSDVKKYTQVGVTSSALDEALEGFYPVIKNAKVTGFFGPLLQNHLNKKFDPQVRSARIEQPLVGIPRQEKDNLIKRGRTLFKSIVQGVKKPANTR